MLHDIWMAATREEAEKAFDTFLVTWEPKYPKAARCLAKDRPVLLTFYDYPAQHWRHLRSTNPIESVFATVRLRHRRTKDKGERDGTNLPGHGLQALQRRREVMAAAQRKSARRRSPRWGKVFGWSEGRRLSPHPQNLTISLSPIISAPRASSCSSSWSRSSTRSSSRRSGASCPTRPRRRRWRWLRLRLEIFKAHRFGRRSEKVDPDQELLAAAEGRPGTLCCGDVQHTLLFTNTFLRPWGFKGPTAEELWTVRSPIASEERRAFDKSLADARRALCEEACTMEGDRLNPAALERQAITRAIVECGILKIRRGRIPPPIPR